MRCKCYLHNKKFKEHCINAFCLCSTQILFYFCLSESIVAFLSTRGRIKLKPLMIYVFHLVQESDVILNRQDYTLGTIDRNELCTNLKIYH